MNSAGADSVLPFSGELKTETKTVSETLANNVEKSYTFTFDCEEIEGICAMATCSTGATACHILYMPQLSGSQFVVGYHSYRTGLNGVSGDQGYRTANITAISGNSVTIRKGGMFANGTATVTATALYKK